MMFFVNCNGKKSYGQLDIYFCSIKGYIQIKWQLIKGMSFFIMLLIIFYRRYYLYDKNFRWLILEVLNYFKFNI